MANLTPAVASVAASADASIVQGKSGATIPQGRPVYLNSSGRYVLADTDVDAATANVAGITLNSTTDGQPIDIITAGTLTVGSVSVIVGGVYVLSGDVGLFADVGDLASGDFTTILGIGLTSTTIKISIIVGGVARVA